MTAQESEIIATMSRDIDEAVMRARKKLAALGWDEGLLPPRKRRAARGER